MSSIAFGYLDAYRGLWDYISISQKFIPIFELASHFPWLHRHLFGNPIVAGLLTPKDAEIAHEAIAGRYAFASDAAEKGKEHKADILGHFIAHDLSQKEAESEAHLQILAGSESTLTVIDMTMLYVVTNPRVYQNLRMFLPLLGLLTKVVPPGGETFNGVFFPGGVEVVISPASLTRRKDIFGEDSDVFRPERWLEADEATHVKYMSTVDLVFGSGRFGCLGKNIGISELKQGFC